MYERKRMSFCASSGQRKILRECGESFPDLPLHQPRVVDADEARVCCWQAEEHPEDQQTGSRNIKAHDPAPAT